MKVSKTLQQNYSETVTYEEKIPEKDIHVYISRKKTQSY